MLKSIEIVGYRGFASSQRVQFSEPRKDAPGSGLTVLSARITLERQP